MVRSRARAEIDHAVAGLDAADRARSSCSRAGRRHRRSRPAAPVESGSGGLLGNRFAQWSDPSPYDPLRVRALAALPPNGLHTSSRPVEHLDSATYWGVAPAPASAAQTFPEPPSAPTWGASSADADGGQRTSEGNGAAQNETRIISDATPDNDWIPGAQYAGVGHHYVPQAIYGKLPLPRETQKVFEKATTGQLPIHGWHQYDKLHREYEDAVRALMDSFMHSIKAEQMTPDHARSVLKAVTDSPDPRIRAYHEMLRRMRMFRWLRSGGGRGSE